MSKQVNNNDIATLSTQCKTNKNCFPVKVFYSNLNQIEILICSTFHVQHFVVHLVVGCHTSYSHKIFKFTGTAVLLVFIISQFKTILVGHQKVVNFKRFQDCIFNFQ